MTVYDVLLPDQTERITRQARQWKFGKAMLGAIRAVLALLAWLLVGMGKLAYWAVAGLWLAVTWIVAAVKLGWDDARGKPDETDG